MSAEVTPTGPVPNEPPGLVQPPSPAAVGYGALARRMSSRTTDLIAIGIVLIGGLSMGRQIVEWWQTPPAAVSPAAGQLPGDVWDDPAAAVHMEFGDAPLSLARQRVTGDREAAVKRLVEICRTTVRTARRPRHEPVPAETELLSRIAGKEPIAGEAGVWGVHSLDDRFSVVVGERTFVSEEAGDAVTSRRLVCWGMALPMGTDQWVLYTFVDSAGQSVASGWVPDLPLPSGARRNLALRDDRGGGVIGFSGDGEPGAWREHFEARLGTQNWVSRNGWWVEGGTASAGFVKESRPEGGRIEIQFSGDVRGGMTGLIHMLPGAAAAPADK